MSTAVTLPSDKPRGEAEACDPVSGPEFSLRGGVSVELLKLGTLSHWKAILAVGCWFSKWGPRTSVSNT